MGAHLASARQRPAEAAGLYHELEDRILARDQVGASRAYYDL